MLRLGYDIGGMSVRACLLDDQAMEILAQQTQPFPIGQGEDAFIDLLAEMAESISRPLGLGPQDHKSVGMGLPGTVNRNTGVLISACNLHLNGLPAVARLQQRFPNAKIAVANDADVAALAEHRAGAFQGYDSAMLVTVGTGSGSGLIVNGKLFGGGLATLPFLTQMRLRHPDWFTQEMLVNMVAVSESTPGPLGVNMATYVGYTVSGVPGAILSTLSLVLPSLIISGRRSAGHRI